LNSNMAKSLRSKIKRKFRTELRKRIGVPHQTIQDEKIQANLRKAIETQSKLAQGTDIVSLTFTVVLICGFLLCLIIANGSSMMGLKALMGTMSAPVAVVDADGMEVDSGSLAQTEAQLLNETMTEKEKKKLLKSKLKKPTTKRKKKQLQFHPLRKKGV
jgi:hypothetical protein